MKYELPISFKHNHIDNIASQTLMNAGQWVFDAWQSHLYSRRMACHISNFHRLPKFRKKCLIDID